MVTAAHEIRMLILGWKVWPSIACWKSRILPCQQDYQSRLWFSTVFVCGCEVWTVKKSWAWRIDMLSWANGAGEDAEVMDCRKIQLSPSQEVVLEWLLEGTDAEAQICLTPQQESWLTTEEPQCWGEIGGRRGWQRGDGWMASRRRAVWFDELWELMMDEEAATCCSCGVKSWNKLNWLELRPLLKKPEYIQMKSEVAPAIIQYTLPLSI